MPRCVICNYCSETDDYRSVNFIWSEEDNGETCSECREAIHEANFYSHEDLDGEEHNLEKEDNVELSEVLGVIRLGEAPDET